VIVFLIVLFILSKYAWKPILSALKEREESIEESLQQAQKARDEMAKLKADNERLINEAREESNRILHEAREIREATINKSKEEAKEEYAKIVEQARHEIDRQKEAAMADLKSHVGLIAVEIAEKVIKKELDNRQAQKEYISGLVEDFKLN